MTHAECEIVANAGVQLREIAERLTLPAGWVPTRALWDQVELVKAMDAAALSISEVYGQLSALPLETEVAAKPSYGSALDRAERAMFDLRGHVTDPEVYRIVQRTMERLRAELAKAAA